jgi:hypothetical protein
MIDGAEATRKQKERLLDVLRRMPDSRPPIGRSRLCPKCGCSAAVDDDASHADFQGYRCEKHGAFVEGPDGFVVWPTNLVPTPWWDDVCQANMAATDRKPQAHGFVIR